MNNFGTDFRNIITADSSLNSLVNGGIYYENLPDNFDLEKSWIVYTYSRIEQYQTLQNPDYFSKYLIILKIISPDSGTCDSISNELYRYLNGKKGGGILDIWSTGDDHSLNLEQGVYSIELTFESFFIKS